MKQILTLALILVSAGCSASEIPSAPIGSLSSARTVWEAQWGEDYRFDFERSCFCPPPVTEPVTVDVRGGVIASVVSRNTGRPVEDVAGLEWYTIEDLFRLIEEAEAQGQAVEVEYAREGYPSRIEIGEIAADAGILFRVSNVRRM